MAGNVFLSLAPKREAGSCSSEWFVLACFLAGHRSGCMVGLR